MPAIIRFWGFVRMPPSRMFVLRTGNWLWYVTEPGFRNSLFCSVMCRFGSRDLTRDENEILI